MMNLFENIAFYAAERHHQKKWLNLANKKNKQTKKEKKSIFPAVINIAGSKKEHASAVSGVLLFDMWEKNQKANKTFLYIKNHIILVHYTCCTYSWSIHGQIFIIIHSYLLHEEIQI